MNIEELVKIYSSLFNENIDVSSSIVTTNLDTVHNEFFHYGEVIGLERIENDVLYITEFNVRIKFSDSEDLPVIILPINYSAYQGQDTVFQPCQHLKSRDYLFSVANIKLFQEAKNKFLLNELNKSDFYRCVVELFKVPEIYYCDDFSLSRTAAKTIPVIERIIAINAKNIKKGSLILLSCATRKTVKNITDKFLLVVSGVSNRINPCIVIKVIN